MRLRQISEKKLTAKARKNLDDSSFVYPDERRYPINDPNHARNALSRVSQHGSSAEKAKVKAAVRKKYPNIELYNEDAKTFSHKEKFDRILMPLPKSAEDFLDNAKKLLKKNGTIHFYDFLSEKDIPKRSIETIKQHIKRFKVLEVAKCGQYGPGKLRVCLDIKIL